MTTGGLFLQRHLEQMLPGVVSQRYPRLRFYDGLVLPIIPDLEPGAAEVVRVRFSEVANAILMADGATDIPVVNLSMREERFRTFAFAASFSYSFQEMRAYEKAEAEMGPTVPARKQATAMRAIAERIDRFAAFGDASLGVTGYLNDPDVTAVNDTSSDLWSLTPDQLRAYLMDHAATIFEASIGTFDRVNVWVSQAIHSLLVNTRMTDSQQSVMASILGEPDGYIASIRWLPYLGSAQMAANGAGQAGADRIVFAPQEPPLPEGIDLEMSLDLATTAEMHIEPVQMMPQEYWETRNLRTVIPMFMVVSPALILQPSGFRYVDVNDRP